MERLFAESRAALDNEEHLGPETRKTAQRAASMSRRTGEDRIVWRQRSSLTTRPLVKSKTQVFDNGGAMSHVRCPLWRAFQPEGERMSFCNQTAAAIDGARTLTRLDHLSKAIWQALAAGAVGDDDAQSLP